MNKQQEQEAKTTMARLMQAGCNWQEAARQVGLETTESTAYYWLRKYRKQGEEGMIDERHGHVVKVTETVLRFIEAAWQKDPHISSRSIKEQLNCSLSVQISITHLNRTRAKHGWSRPLEEKKREKGSVFKMGQVDSCC